MVGGDDYVSVSFSFFFWHSRNLFNMFTSLALFAQCLCFYPFSEVDLLWYMFSQTLLFSLVDSWVETFPPDASPILEVVDAYYISFSGRSNTF